MAFSQIGPSWVEGSFSILWHFRCHGPWSVFFDCASIQTQPLLVFASLFFGSILQGGTPPDGYVEPIEHLELDVLGGHVEKRCHGDSWVLRARGFALLMDLLVLTCQCLAGARCFESNMILLRMLGRRSLSSEWIWMLGYGICVWCGFWCHGFMCIYIYRILRTEFMRWQDLCFCEPAFLVSPALRLSGAEFGFQSPVNFEMLCCS